MKQIALASKSPRRSDILHKAGIEFHLVKSDYNEELDNKIFSYKKIETLAKNKAFGALANLTSPAYVLSADTVVVSGNKILTKPIDKEDAYKTLQLLSGKEHSVVTSLCLVDSETQIYIVKSTTTKVEFNRLSAKMINYYVDKFLPMDKAGAYGIQELPEGYINTVTGDLENVIGLSSKAVKSAIQELQTILEESREKCACPQD